jgi:hypothetical protein
MPLEDVQKHPWIIKHCKKGEFDNIKELRLSKQQRKSVLNGPQDMKPFTSSTMREADGTHASYRSAGSL